MRACCSASSTLADRLLQLTGTISERDRTFEGTVQRTGWMALRKTERRALAHELSAKLKDMNVVNARVLAFKTPKKTVRTPGMASNPADLLDLEQDDVLVAIEPDRANLLHVS